MIQVLLNNFEDTFAALEQGFRVLERKLPAPVPTHIDTRVYPRYRERSAEQAALQKVARYISGLHALTVLLKHKHLQEDGTLKRTLDELGDDVMFLLLEPQNEKEKVLHRRFLEGFYAEEFDPGLPAMESKRKRKRPLRREIRDYVKSRSAPTGAESARALDVVYQAYSGYVHADSPHLMEMWDWDSRRYELVGIKDRDLLASHIADATNYFVRGFYNLAALASRLGEEKLFVSLKQQGDDLAKLAATL